MLSVGTHLGRDELLMEGQKNSHRKSLAELRGSPGRTPGRRVILRDVQCGGNSNKGSGKDELISGY